MKIQTKERAAVLTHPQHPEIQVEVRRLLAAEKAHFRKMLKEKVYKEALRDAAGEIIRGETGEIVTYGRIRDEAELEQGVLRAAIKNLIGFTDEDDKPVKFDFETHFPQLYEGELRVKDGEREITFAQWILQAVQKTETFDPDPPQSNSEQPSTDS